jgi:hypothetical protein
MFAGLSKEGVLQLQPIVAPSAATVVKQSIQDEVEEKEHRVTLRKAGHSMELSIRAYRAEVTSIAVC